MRSLGTYWVCVLGLCAAIYLVWEKGTVIEQSVTRNETDNYVYVVNYKVTRYELKKAETDSPLDRQHIEQGGLLQPGSREFDFRHWLDRK